MKRKPITETERYRQVVRIKIKENNKWARRDKYAGNDYIVFPSYKHAHLFIEEITGQLSDGAWENTRNTKWEYFADLQVKVKPNKKGKTYIVGNVPNHTRFDYNEIIWLFDANEDYEKYPDVRYVFNEKRFPRDELRAIMRDIFIALNRRGK